jgi:hypothetical protein
LLIVKLIQLDNKLQRDRILHRFGSGYRSILNASSELVVNCLAIDKFELCLKSLPEFIGISEVQKPDFSKKSGFLAKLVVMARRTIWGVITRNAGSRYYSYR